MNDSRTPITDALIRKAQMTPLTIYKDFNALADSHSKLETDRAALVAALETITDHACEMYPHFEDVRGQCDIAAARAVLAKVQS